MRGDKKMAGDRRELRLSVRHSTRGPFGFHQITAETGLTGAEASTACVSPAWSRPRQLGCRVWMLM